MIKSVILSVLLLVAFSATASAEKISYYAMNPDKSLCIFTQGFGFLGDGEYSIIIDDPGYPDNSWVDIHHASMKAGAGNIVVVPVCISTDGRNIGDEAILKFHLSTPSVNKTSKVGICVSKFEDTDTIELDEDDQETVALVTPDNPCDAMNNLADLFSMDITESVVFASPGEKISLKLLVYSDFYMDIELSKTEGPKMDIEKTSLSMPENEEIAITIEAPQKKGIHPFTIRADVVGCTKPSCYREVSGFINVSDAPGYDYYASLSQKNVDISEAKTTKFILTIDNRGEADDFTVAYETDEKLSLGFSRSAFSLGAGAKKEIDIFVTPESEESLIHFLRVTVKDSSGLQMVLQSTLTVKELLSDAKRINEKNPGTVDTKNVNDQYNSGKNVPTWTPLTNNNTKPDPEPEPEPPSTWIIMVIIVASVVAISVFYIYKKSSVTSDYDSTGFQSVDD